MDYKNGKDILPAELLEQIQKYVQGELVYIPKKGDQRAAWGERNGTRETLARRNREIFTLHRNGLTMDALIERYHLSEESLRKIITRTGVYETI